MRHCLTLALAVALAMPPRVAQAGWSQAQRDTLDRIIALENDGDLAGAVKLAVQEVAQTTAPPGYRRAVARRGRAAAVALFDKTTDSSRLAHLCTAVELTRKYQAELIDSEEDRRDVPVDLARLEAQAVAAGAPCARPPPPPIRADPPPAATPRPAPEPLPALPVPARRSRPRLAAGGGLVTAGVGLVAGFAGCFVARVPEGERVVALDKQATAAGRDLTGDELNELLDADARYVRLSNTGKVLAVANRSISSVHARARAVSPACTAARTRGAAASRVTTPSGLTTKACGCPAFA